MSKGTVNTVMLIGNVGRDPEIKKSQTDMLIANLTLATSEIYKQEEQTEWHSIVAFGKLAETIEKYVHKGDKIFIEGKLKTRKWQDKETGKDRYKTEILADKMQMLGSSKRYHSEEVNVIDDFVKKAEEFFHEDIKF
ncbi:Ssb Single-stranded DNA-binding protein [uncultured Caudovirales phage]|uniref:Ssb Single-stranded DNA-binding protein n=1 Tax=uncultured Caudovirales phage TaxID=2100421 RepID=A0A6J5LLP5_9CAUD|nr:Ssb Single-stranded DNA-binding protein [uncultured Caudovirales phage]